MYVALSNQSYCAHTNLPDKQVVPVELNPALLSADPRGYDAYQDNADEDGSIPGTSTPGTGPTWHHSCSVSCQVQALLVSKCIATPAATPSETEILNTMIFSLTTDPHTPVKLSVEQNEICRRGSTGGLLRSELLGRIWRSC